MPDPEWEKGGELRATLVVLDDLLTRLNMNSERSETAIDSREALVQSTSAAASDQQQASNPGLTEDIALALLNRRDLPAEAVEQLARNATITKSRKVRFAIATHPHTPRHISRKLIREFYTFDLMRYAVTPGVAADLKRAADELLVTRLPSITLGERISLARRGSESVAAALLLDKESRVWQTALENGRLTEAAVVRALLRPNTSAALVKAVCHHTKWSPRHEVRIALLRNEKTPLARALEFARTLPPPQLRDILHSSHLPEKLKLYLRKDLKL